MRGIAFEPIESFSAIVNTRTSAFLIVAGLFVANERLVEKGINFKDWLPKIRSVVQMSILVLIFGLITGEVRDYFRNQMVATGGDAEDTLASLSNLQQLSLSGVWLVYSVVLMGSGLWKKHRGLRIAAFVLFGITILKIFLYDLSFLDTLYRIFSFIALGVVLLGVSFAYQRYKDVIFGEETEQGKTAKIETHSY